MVRQVLSIVCLTGMSLSLLSEWRMPSRLAAQELATQPLVKRGEVQERNFSGWTKSTDAAVDRTAVNPTGVQTVAYHSQIELPSALPSAMHSDTAMHNDLHNGFPSGAPAAFPGRPQSLPNSQSLPPLPSSSRNFNQPAADLPSGNSLSDAAFQSQNVDQGVMTASQQRDVLPDSRGQSGPNVLPGNGLSGTPTNAQVLPANRGSDARDPRQNPAGNQQQPDLRGVQPQPQSPQPGRLDPQNVATGYPFVSPAPGTGRYPTSPYYPHMYQTAAYQLAAYQRPAPAYQAATAAGQAQSQLRSQSLNGQLAAAQQVPNQAATNQQLLPQYRQPGIYPTAYQQCNPPLTNFPPTGAVPGNYLPPTLTPNLTPGLYSSNNSGYAPLFSLGQENYNVQLGRGIIGQPTVYVPSQPVRNFFRYLSP